MRQLTDRLGCDGGRRLVRYVAVSAVGILATQALLLAGLLVGLSAASANVVACLGAAVPIFHLNRSYVWERSTPAAFAAEVVPFWVLTIVGLLLSTVAVSAMATITTTPLVLAAANIGAFGVLWVAKYLVLDAAAEAAGTAPVPTFELDGVAA